MDQLVIHRVIEQIQIDHTELDDELMPMRIYYLLKTNPKKKRKINLTKIAILSSSRTSFNAPISSNVTSGTVAKPSRLLDGWTLFKATYVCLKYNKYLENKVAFSFIYPKIIHGDST